MNGVSTPICVHTTLPLALTGGWLFVWSSLAQSSSWLLLVLPLFPSPATAASRLVWWVWPCRTLFRLRRASTGSFVRLLRWRLISFLLNVCLSMPHYPARRLRSSPRTGHQSAGRLRVLSLLTTTAPDTGLVLTWCSRTSISLSSQRRRLVSSVVLVLARVH